MSFNRQPNMFFDKIISYTCDMHLKLDILSPLIVKWLLKWVIYLVALSFKISRLWKKIMI
jgi:hypothetical protein